MEGLFLFAVSKCHLLITINRLLRKRGGCKGQEEGRIAKEKKIGGIYRKGRSKDCK